MSEILDKFGKELMLNVRDAAIDDANSLLAATSKAPGDQQLQEKLSQFDEKQKLVIWELVRLAIDSSVHNMLWMMEESGSFDILLQGRAGKCSKTQSTKRWFFGRAIY